MAGVAARSFDDPSETRTPSKSRVDVVEINGLKAARLTLEPGWRWSECIKPVVGTESCQAKHFGAAISGKMHVVHDDGTEVDISAGNAYTIDPGHDAWVVGDETFVGYEFESPTAASFAKNVAEHAAATTGHIS